MKSICLINPPSPFLMDEKVFIPLGILRVAASLENYGYRVYVLDLAGTTDWKHCVDERVPEYDIVGFSSTTPQIPIVSKIAQYIRATFVKPLVLGGPHATVVIGACKKSPKRSSSKRAKGELKRLQKIFDYIVCGDGELAILDILQGLDQQIVDSELHAKWFLTDEKYDKLPLPARHLIDMNSYHYTIDGERATNVICQMGCPFGCNFCSGRMSKTFRKVRSRSIQSVLKEIDFLYRTYGYKGFMFYDDELNLNKSKFDEFLNTLISYQKKKQVKFKLRGFTRADLLTQEQAEKMYKAGFRWLLTGFESGSNKILFNMNKKNSVKDNTRACQLARDAGLKVKALMSIGHPGESQSTIKETEEWLVSVRPDDFDITIISAYPGTPYFDLVEWDKPRQTWNYTHPESGDRLYLLDVDYAKDSVFYKSAPDQYESFVFTDHLTCQDLVEERKRLEYSLKERLYGGRTRQN